MQTQSYSPYEGSSVSLNEQSDLALKKESADIGLTESTVLEQTNLTNQIDLVDKA
jgi:hypothetical protein